MFLHHKVRRTRESSSCFSDRGLLISCRWASRLPASPCLWWWTPCGRCGASEPASMTTSTPAPWRRGSTRWKTSSPSTSLWLLACRQASSCSWPTYYGENTDTTSDQGPNPTRCCAFVRYVMLHGVGPILKLARDTIWILWSSHLKIDHVQQRSGCHRWGQLHSTNPVTKIHKDSENLPGTLWDGGALFVCLCLSQMLNWSKYFNEIITAFRGIFCTFSC